MKKLFCFISIIIGFALLPASADEFNSSQLKLRNEIKTFLQEEGYMPEIDSDGDIAFKKEGDKYYVIVSRNDTSPMYVTINKYFSYGDKYNRQTIASGLESTNLIKGVKVLLFENNYDLQAGMYLVDSENFKYVFYKVMKQLDSLEERVDKICASGNSGSSYGSSGSGYSSDGGTGTLINDTFSSNTSAWTSSEGKLSFRNGKMLFEDEANYGWTELYRAIPRNLTSKDFELTFSMKISFKEDYSSIRFLIGSTSDMKNHAYCFSISKWGEKLAFSFGTYGNGNQYHGYESYEMSPVVTHHYKMIKRGQSVTCYADGTLLFICTVDSIDINQVAFYISHFHQIEVDDFTIKLL